MALSLAKQIRRKILAFVMAASVFLTALMVMYTILPSATSMTFIIGIDHADRFQLFYWNGLRKEKYQEKYSFRSKKIKATDKTKISFKLENTPIRRIRLDVGDRPGVVKIYRLKLTSHFSKPKTFSAEGIFQAFKAGKKGMSLHLRDGYVEVQSTCNDPQLISEKPLLIPNPLLFFGLPFVFAAVFYIILLKFDPSQFPALRDIGAKKPSSGSNIEALDGLRGLAALMVVGDHTYGHFTGLGAGGVWIFMVLSGFLLARPFVEKPARVFSADYMGHFFLRRVQRIIPIYYFYITIVFMLSNRFSLAIRHYLFLEGSGHLWVIPQEIIFYLFVPIIMGINYFLFREKRALMVISLLIMMVLANKLLGANVISLYGMQHQHLRLYIGVFISGLMFSYLYYGVYRPAQSTPSNVKWIEYGFSILGILMLIIFLFGSTERLYGGTRVYAQIYFPWFGVAAGSLIFCIVAGGNTILNKVLSWKPLRALSIVSLSLYLIHPLVLTIIRKAVMYFHGTRVMGMKLFLATLILSYLVACLTYTYIEKPFLEPKKRRVNDSFLR